MVTRFDNPADSFTPRRARQPNSFLQPRPAFGSPQGNAAPSFLTGRGTTGIPAITPRSEIAPGERKAAANQALAVQTAERLAPTGGITPRQGGETLINGVPVSQARETMPELFSGKGASFAPETAEQRRVLPLGHADDPLSGAFWAQTQPVSVEALMSAGVPKELAERAQIDWPGTFGTGGTSPPDEFGIRTVGDLVAHGFSKEEAERLIGNTTGKAKRIFIGPGSTFAGLNLGPNAPRGGVPAPGTAAGAGSNMPPLQRLFQFLKEDLQRERDIGLSEADVDAARRGVFFGTPGAQSRQDVTERFQRGLGQLDASLIQNETQNELARLGLAAQLLPQDIEESGGIDPAVFQALGGLFQSGGGQTRTKNPFEQAAGLVSSFITPKAKAKVTAKTQPRLRPPGPIPFPNIQF